MSQINLEGQSNGRDDQQSLTDYAPHTKRCAEDFNKQPPSQRSPIHTKSRLESFTQAAFGFMHKRLLAFAIPYSAHLAPSLPPSRPRLVDRNAVAQGFYLAL